MKWTAELTEKLTKMAFAGESNKDIATALDIHITDVYAKRSQLGITIDKVKTRKAATINQDFEDAFPKPQVKHTGLETFNNAGELCIVLTRHGDTALIVMPTKTAYPFVVPLLHKAGASDWWHGEYFNTFEDAYTFYLDKIVK